MAVVTWIMIVRHCTHCHHLGEDRVFDIVLRSVIAFARLPGEVSGRRSI